MKNINSLGNQLAHKTSLKIKPLFKGGVILVACLLIVLMVVQPREEGEEAALSNFSGQMIGQQIQLEWQSLNRQDSQFFQIERSFDGMTYEFIGQVEAATLTKDFSQYIFLDENVDHVDHPTLFYRIKQVTSDGIYQYSKILPVSLGRGMAVTLNTRVNDSTRKLTIQYTSQDEEALDMRIINARGKVVLRKNLPMTPGYGKLSLDISSWENGTYYLQVYNSTITKMEKVTI